MYTQVLYSLTRIHLVLDHLFPLITGQPPENYQENSFVNLTPMLCKSVDAIGSTTNNKKEKLTMQT